MSNKFLLLLLQLGIGIAAAVAVAIAGDASEARGQKLRLPSGYNMRLAALPPRLVGKGAYTLATKRASLGAKPSKFQQLTQQQKQQQQLTQWASTGGKKYNNRNQRA